MKSNIFKSFGKRKKTMRIRLFSALMAFTFVVLVLLWLFQIVFIDELYKSIMMNNVDIVSAGICENIDDGEIENTVTEYAEKYDICISVYDLKKNDRGKPSFENTASECVYVNCRVHMYNVLGAMHFYDQAKKSADGEFLQMYGQNSQTNGMPPSNPDMIFPDGNENYEEDSENESMLYAKIIHTESGNEYLMILNAVITPLNSVVASLRMVFLVIAVMMIAMATIISIVVSEYFLSPIKRINSAAKMLAKGNYDVKFDEDSYSEIAQLAATLNYASQELSTVETTRRELIANVSHDLRTPLTLISGYAEMVRDFPNEDNRESLQTIIDEVNHMTLLVNDMTDVSKYNAGVQTLNAFEFDLTQCVADTVDRLNKLNTADGYVVDFIYEKPVSIIADELKITQVLYNLINNAVTHTGDDKRVVVRQTLSEENHVKYARITITDSGKGILAENVRNIWDRYFKIDKTYKRAHNGSGLGLNIVKSVLELHKMEYGVVPVEEMPDNIGCTFWFKTKIISNGEK